MTDIKLAKMSDEQMKCIKDLEDELGVNLVAYSIENNVYAQLGGESLRKIKELEAKMGSFYWRILKKKRLSGGLMYNFKNVFDYSNEVLFNIVHFKHNRNLRANVLINQVYFTAIQALPLVCLMSFFIGISIVELGHSLIGGTQSAWIYEILIATAVRDVAPILTGIVILLRSGNAITTELGAMRVEKEIDALIGMGISPISYLVAPRVVGLLLSAIRWVFILVL